MASARKALNHGMKSYLDVIGKTDHDLFPKEEADKTFADTMRVIETGITLHTIESLTLPIGITCWYSVEKCPLRDPDGNIIGSICTSRDITKQIATQEELKEANRKYAEANEKLEEMSKNILNLLAVAAHHLRSPLTSLATDIKLMQRGLIKNQKVTFDDMLLRISKMQELITRYLSITALMNKGEPTIEKIDFSVTVIPPILDFFKKGMEEKKIKYDNSLGGIRTDAILVLETDQTYLDAILKNLIGNVIKHSDEGTNFAVGHRIITRDGKEFHEINVFDNGTPITEEVKERMFNEGFSTGGSSGLGLAHSRSLAEKLGGYLFFKPTWDGYNNFILQIPVIN